MRTLHLVENSESKGPVVWEAFPSWSQFTWLYLLSAVSALRGALFFRFEVGGWEMWIVGAGLLIVCAAALRPLRTDEGSAHGAQRVYGAGDSIHSLE